MINKIKSVLIILYGLKGHVFLLFNGNDKPRWLCPKLRLKEKSTRLCIFKYIELNGACRPIKIFCISVTLCVCVCVCVRVCIFYTLMLEVEPLLMSTIHIN